MSTNHRPRFEHGCDRCTFIGQLADFDIYTCGQGSWPTVIARYGSDGPEYQSGSDLSHLFGVRITPEIEPRHLQQSFVQEQANVVATINRYAGQLEDTDTNRFRLAAEALGRVRALYRLGWLGLDPEPTLESVRQRVDSVLNLAGHKIDPESFA